MVSNEGFRHSIEFERGHPGLDPSGDLRQRSPNKQRTQSNELDLFIRFDSDSST
jgi:hypothetical protein